ncbi:uncharacterized protein [Zea mays]|uniref:uncharacterized protein n=1 Tax=Zea mays TaxID=4577 RepID=UPI0004DE9DA4|nr:uncharacterized protein LOC103651611 [Zea mays]|eukprot:XP_008675498.1 uncharacterized protein LOC103651611 [Zea mays]
MAKALSDLLAEETRLNYLSSTGSNTHNVLAAAQKPKSVFKPCDHYGKTNHRSELCFVKFPEKLTDFRARRAARGPGPSTRGSVAVAATLSACTSESARILDSGASFHVTSDQSKLASTTPVTDGASVQTADGEVIGTSRRRRAAPRLYILDSLRLPSLATSPVGIIFVTVALLQLQNVMGFPVLVPSLLNHHLIKRLLVYLSGSLL